MAHHDISHKQDATRVGNKDFKAENPTNEAKRITYICMYPYRNMWPVYTINYNRGKR